MRNEAITIDLTRDILKELGYNNYENIVIEREKSSNSRIDKLLQTASKRGSNKGYPDFIITDKNNDEFVCVIECKADPQRHQSSSLDKYQDYAVDGARLYAEYLSKENDVLYIGVSGQNKHELRVSHFLKLRGEKSETELFKNSQLQDFSTYVTQYKRARFRVDYESLLKYVSGLNEELHSKKIPEKERALLFSGILIALEDDTFRNTYDSYSNTSRLATFLISSITTKLTESNVQLTKQEGLKIAYSALSVHQSLIADGYLKELISDIDKHIRDFIKSNEYHDIISRCYIEFLKYANDDGSLGIVLTPQHITELFCEIADLTVDSIILDNCCGTGGFLVAAMGRLVELAGHNKKITLKAKIEEIKTKQILGIEYQNHIFNLCVSNMIIHGDGKSNILQGDCFKLINELKEINTPDVALLNPPYNDVSGIDELEFIENALSILQKNGTAVAIIPMRCALYTKGKGLEIKRRILESHSLDAVMSMPDELFYPKGVICCVMVFKAHIPHNPKKKTWFGYWKDDGHIKIKHRGRLDSRDEWFGIKNQWLDTYRNRDSIPGQCITHSVSERDEWCAEAYLETDYSQLTKKKFEDVVRNYAIYNLLNSSSELE